MIPFPLTVIDLAFSYASQTTKRLNAFFAKIHTTTLTLLHYVPSSNMVLLVDLHRWAKRTIGQFVLL